MAWVTVAVVERVQSGRLAERQPGGCAVKHILQAVFLKMPCQQGAHGAVPQIALALAFAACLPSVCALREGVLLRKDPGMQSCGVKHIHRSQQGYSAFCPPMPVTNAGAPGKSSSGMLQKQPAPWHAAPCLALRGKSRPQGQLYIRRGASTNQKERRKRETSIDEPDRDMLHAASQQSQSSSESSVTRRDFMFDLFVMAFSGLLGWLFGQGVIKDSADKQTLERLVDMDERILQVFPCTQCACFYLLSNNWTPCYDSA